jgi:NADH:ubiquinone reductase (non-electrogenic)
MLIYNNASHSFFLALPRPLPHPYLARATRVDLGDKVVACQEVFIDERFEINYEYLVLAVGSTTNTFGIPGVCVENHVYFLKQLR